MTHYFLRTTRLGFRTWSADDLELAWGLWGDPDVTRLIGGALTREQVEQRLASEIASYALYRVQYFPVFLLETNAQSSAEHVGCCGLRPYQPDQQIYELGFHLRPAYWGHGYAKEAAKAAVAYAFYALEVAGLFAGHHPANEASRSLLTALGFHYTHDEHYAPTGLDHPSYLLTAQAFGNQ